MCLHEPAVKAVRTVCVIDCTLADHCFLTENEAVAIPALKEVPKTLWASSQFDVGLIKNCEPVQITPKSDYRPCTPQYSIKKESVEGITPIIKSSWDNCDP